MSVNGKCFNRPKLETLPP